MSAAVKPSPSGRLPFSWDHRHKPSPGSHSGSNSNSTSNSNSNLNSNSGSDYGSVNTNATSLNGQRPWNTDFYGKNTPEIIVISDDDDDDADVSIRENDEDLTEDEHQHLLHGRLGDSYYSTSQEYSARAAGTALKRGPVHRPREMRAFELSEYEDLDDPADLRGSTSSISSLSVFSDPMAATVNDSNLFVHQLSTFKRRKVQYKRVARGGAAASSASRAPSSSLSSPVPSKLMEITDDEDNMDVTVGHPLNNVKYSPPRRPIVKAQDVPVDRVYDQLSPSYSTSPTKMSATTNASSIGPNPSHDDKDGHYIVKPNRLFANRFEIVQLLGQGTFGKVVSAYDTKTGKHVAVKIIRAVGKYRDASRIELRVLRTLSMYDRRNKNKCIHLRECFDYLNHICIVTDLLGMSIFDFMKSNDFAPFPAHHIQHLAAQLLRSVMFLHDLNLIHTDLKPENILLVKDEFEAKSYKPHWKKRSAKFKDSRNILKNTDIHLIDFGSAIFNDEYHSSVVSTRHYRAPEIILGIGWSFPCDLWSIGCILVELCTGDALFQTHENSEHLAFMEKVTGKQLPRWMLKDALLDTNGSKCVNAESNGVLFPTCGTEKDRVILVNNAKRFDQRIRVAQNRENSLLGAPRSVTRDFWDNFVDLVGKMFIYDPNKRITAREALAHPFFKCSVPVHPNTHIM